MEKYKKLSTLDFSKLKCGNVYEKGILNLTLVSWEQFSDVAKIFNEADYIWRGQGQDYDGGIKPSFYRVNNERYKKIGLSVLFNALKKRLGDVKEISQLNEDEVWAIGQHYGLATPLLDWTEDPYIAAYFAFCDENIEKDGNVVICAVNRVIGRLVQGKEGSRVRLVDFDLLSSNLDEMHVERLKSQKGTFTKVLENENIELVSKELWEKRKKDYENKILFSKIFIPRTSKGDCLSSLRLMGITRGTLFPDYAGAVDACKHDLGLD